MLCQTIYLSPWEREEIAVMLATKLSKSAIARALGLPPSTIAGEAVGTEDAGPLVVLETRVFDATNGRFDVTMIEQRS